MKQTTSTSVILSLLASVVSAQGPCPSFITPAYPAPSVAPGFKANIIATGLTKPRGITFDSAGNLLVVESGKGVTAIALNDQGGSCISVKSSKTFVTEKTLNHAILVSPDGKTIYASSKAEAYSWPYDAASMKTTGNRTTLVTGMNNSGHSTRTLLLSEKNPGLLLVSRGSEGNLDPKASDITTGHSQIRYFNISGPGAPFNYASSGTMVGWGLRNSVGMAEHPVTGGLYSVENGADDLKRNGRDIHVNNPGEEMNYHGPLMGNLDANFGKNFGYPDCYATWKPAELADASALSVGKQFAMGNLNATHNDDTCRSKTVSPRLTFPAHWAPLDIKFNSKGTISYITSHGSWNRIPPDGYQVFAVPFNGASGAPIPDSSSPNSWVPILSNQNMWLCPLGCFRPVALAFDSKGRLYMTSDSTGEIYVITTTDGGSVNDVQTVAGTGANSANSQTGSAPSMEMDYKARWLLTAACAVGLCF